MIEKDPVLRLAIGVEVDNDRLYQYQNTVWVKMNSMLLMAMGYHIISDDSSILTVNDTPVSVVVATAAASTAHQSTAIIGCLETG